MTASVLVVAEYQFQLSRDVDIAELIQQIEHAVHAGGQMVSIPVGTAQSVFVLISQGLSVVLHASIDDDGPPPLSISDNTEWDTSEFELGAFF